MTSDLSFNNKFQKIAEQHLQHFEDSVSKMLQLPRYGSYMKATTYSQSFKDSENITDLCFPEKDYFKNYSNLSEHGIIKARPKKNYY